jgi:hypothetical protein
MKTLRILSALAVFAAANLAAADGKFTVKKHDKGVTVQLDGAPFVEYVIGDANKPYLWPVIGPTGKPVTRAFPMRDIPGEQTDHAHHRGIWFGHENINGFDSWYEELSFKDSKLKGDALKQRLAKIGSIRHREFTEVSAQGDRARIVAINDYLAPDGKRSFEEERRLTFSMLGDSRVIDYEIEFKATTAPVTFGDIKDAGFNIRVPTEMAVDSKKGGRIVNSDGITDKDAWAKRAKWCDYTGPVEGEPVGFAVLNHPSSFRFPTPWHVRTYGLFTANPFGTKSLDPKAEDGTFVLKPGEKLLLKHRIIIHKDTMPAEQIEAAWKQYAAEK